MTQVSKYPLSKLVYQRIFEIFFESVLKIKNEEEAEEFFSEFLSPTEKIVLAKRISIAVLLSKKYDYNSIKKILHVSTSTISDVNVLLKYAGSGYRRVVEKLLREEKVNNILTSVLEGIATIGAVGGKDSGDWRTLKKSIQNKKRFKPF